MTETEHILTALLDCRRVDLYTRPLVLTSGQQKIFEDIQSWRRKGEPLQYLLGEWEFMGLSLKMAPGVFIPRPETELLVEAVVAEVEGSPRREWRILELGTGSGNIAVSLAKLLPQTQITSVDISFEALSLARENARRHAVEGRIRFLQGDMRDLLACPDFLEEPFDIIVSNPPYIESGRIAGLPPEVRREPFEALDGGADGMDYYRDIVAQGKFLLKRGGKIYLEIGDGQRPGLERLFQGHAKPGDCDFRKDYSGMERVAVIQPDQNIMLEGQPVETRA